MRLRVPLDDLQGGDVPEAALVGEELYILAILILLALALGERLQLPVPPSWLRVVALSLE